MPKSQPATESNVRESASDRPMAGTTAPAVANPLDAFGYGETARHALSIARWSDVQEAADAFAPFVSEARKNSKTASETARKAGAVAPREAAMLRFALVSYSLAGKRANPTQLAELAGKLPELRSVGAIRDKSVTFGGIVLPPLVGEL